MAKVEPSRAALAATCLVLALVTAPGGARAETTELSQRPASLAAGESVNPDFDAALRRYERGERPKILGGIRAPDGAHPWQVSLGVSWIPGADQAHFCGGSIYDARWIVTAAHCVQKTKLDYLTVTAGTSVLSPDLARVKASRLILHKNYDPMSKDNDIALIELAEPLTLAGAVQPIGLLKEIDEDAILAEDQLLTVTGWGATTEGGAAVTELQQITIPFVNRTACNDLLSYNGKVTENMICAGRAAGGQDSCQGDSGGPLIHRDPTGAATLVGVVSWGEGCARPGLYGVYARVPRYAEWVSKCVLEPDSCQ